MCTDLRFLRKRIIALCSAPAALPDVLFWMNLQPPEHTYEGCRACIRTLPARDMDACGRTYGRIRAGRGSLFFRLLQPSTHCCKKHTVFCSFTEIFPYICNQEYSLTVQTKDDSVINQIIHNLTNSLWERTNKYGGHWSGLCSLPVICLLHS